MTREGVVTKIIGKHTAEVTFGRETSCGQCAANCGACKTQITAKAQNPVSANLGDRVRVESRNALSIAAMVYLAPIALFFAGFLIADWAAFAGLILGILALIPISRRINVTLEITGKVV